MKNNPFRLDNGTNPGEFMNASTNNPESNTDLKELLQHLILDGQNQIHDLRDGTATPEEVTERMFASLDHHAGKVQDFIDQEVAKELSEKQEVIEELKNEIYEANEQAERNLE